MIITIITNTTNITVTDGSGWPTKFPQLGSGDITQDPLYAGASDYHLKADSPCKNAGSNILAPSVDLDGHTRPSGGLFDMGAYEL